MKIKFMGNRNRTNLKYESMPSLHLFAPDITHERAESSTMSVDVEENLIEPCGSQMLSNNDTMQQSDLPGPSGVQQLKRKRTSVQSKTSKKFQILKGNNRRVNFLHEIKLYKRDQLTPKKRKLYSLAKEYLNVARQLELKNSSNAKCLKTVIDMTESGEIFKSKVNKTSLNFIQCQLKQQRKKSRGRRYTLEDNMLGLLLLKQSPKGYKLLQKIFALPSRKILMALLKKVPSGCRINQAILSSLKKSVANLNHRDKHCILLLDEISLHPSLFYNISEDYIDGFEDNGEVCTSRIADHAMVFMLKEVGKKWKQPIAYYFSENGMKSPSIAKCIKAAIVSVQAIGLKVIATICDQFNKPAINMLVMKLSGKSLEKDTYMKSTVLL